MLSCEGTRFTEKKRVASMKVAREKGLPELKHHILPRTKGFVLLLQGAEKRGMLFELKIQKIYAKIKIIYFQLNHYMI